jgi:hypothetical protein
MKNSKLSMLVGAIILIVAISVIPVLAHSGIHTDGTTTTPCTVENCNDTGTHMHTYCDSETNHVNSSAQK